MDAHVVVVGSMYGESKVDATKDKRVKNWLLYKRGNDQICDEIRGLGLGRSKERIKIILEITASRCLSKRVSTIFCSEGLSVMT